MVAELAVVAVVAARGERLVVVARGGGGDRAELAERLVVAVVAPARPGALDVAHVASWRRAMRYVRPLCWDRTMSDGAYLYPTSSNPEYGSGSALFYINGDHVYPTSSNPQRGSGSALFYINGDHVYPTSSNPQRGSGSALFRIQR